MLLLLLSGGTDVVGAEYGVADGEEVVEITTVTVEVVEL